MTGIRAEGTVMAGPKSVAVVQAVENLIAEKQAIALMEREVIESLNEVLNKIGYKVVAMDADASRGRGRRRGRSPRSRRGRPAGTGRKRDPGRAPKNGRKKRRGRPPKTE
jgi:hypothetical protein